MTEWSFAGFGVEISGLCDPIRVRIRKFEEYLGGMLVTCTRHGRHSSGSSLHYQGRAIDFRKYALRHRGYQYNPPAEIVPLTRLQVLAIFPESMFDVLEEEDHFHVEYDPR